VERFAQDAASRVRPKLGLEEAEIASLLLRIVAGGPTEKPYTGTSIAHGVPMAKIVLHDPPYAPDGDEEARRSSREYGEKLKATLSEGRRGEAVELFMTMVGMPQEMIGGMRHTPRWTGLEAIAPTLAYDSEVMGDIGKEGTIPVDQAGRVTVPALVLTGGADYPWMIEVGRRLAEAMPNGRHRVLEGQEHAVPPEVLVPVLEDFFSDGPGP
jgi:pimeloyl-ACP methyl ester carboxylesterase